MKNIFSILLIITFCALSNGDKMVKVKLTDSMSCMLPKSFYMMSDEEIKRRIPTHKKPLAAYTDIDRLVEFTVTQATAKWRNQDLIIAKDFYKSSIMNLYDKVDIIKEEMTKINKRSFAVFEFTSMVKGDKLTKKSIRKYSYVQYTIIDNQTFVFSISTPYRLKNKWSEKAMSIMNSIKIK